MVLAIDLFLVAFAFFLAYLLRYNFVLNDILVERMFWQVFVFTGAFAVSFLVFQPHRGIVRHTSLYDALIVFFSASMPVAVILTIDAVFYSLSILPSLNFSIAVLLIAYMASLFLLLFVRFSIKMFYINLVRHRRQLTNTLIYGAGAMGIATLQTILSAENARQRIVGFVDDNPSKQNKRIGGIRVYGPAAALDEQFLEKQGISELIIAINTLSAERRKQIIERCLKLELEVLTVPGFQEWKKGQLQIKQIRKVRIEELLQRDPIKIENIGVADALKDKTILVTGAAGSIGSEIVRQLCRLQTGRLILLDIAESPLFDLEQEMKASENGNPVNKEFVLADVSNYHRMKRVFEQFRPDIIYHAAAFKHVPIIESHPLEAARVNILGTHNVAVLASAFSSDKFVLISTDKAVNPTSFMGASKRVAELLVKGLSDVEENGTEFIVTRFGNVLGSNGSVIPLFEKQIAAGGPVTVTHPDIIRFFMTIPEACELVLEASVMGRGGEVFVFDMGEQLRIVDVAKKMIRLSGLEPGKDIDIVFTGLRPGEKLYEELFSTCEENQPTHHPKIMIARMQGCKYREVADKLLGIEEALERQDDKATVRIVRSLVPEYTPTPAGEVPSFS
jgi:FlaA1/EpsC-like NDP-sugar epimerase